MSLVETEKASKSSKPILLELVFPKLSGYLLLGRSDHGFSMGRSFSKNQLPLKSTFRGVIRILDIYDS